MFKDPGHDLQSTCGRIQMLATEIFRQGLPPPGAKTELVPGMALRVGRNFFIRYPESLSKCSTTDVVDLGC
jgi:hypothetical protein